MTQNLSKALQVATTAKDRRGKGAAEPVECVGSPIVDAGGLEQKPRLTSEVSPAPLLTG